MMRSVFPLLGALALAACAPTVPDSGAGVGFGDYTQYQRDREAQLRGQGAGIVPRQQIASGSSSPTQASGAPMSAIAGLNDAPAQQQPQGDPSAQEVAQAAMASIAPRRTGAQTPASGTAGPASGQAFEAGTPPSQEETAGERQARMAGEYRMIEPTDVPQRSGDTPNIVAYALRTSNRVGQRIYNRSPIQFRNHERACAEFARQDLAQEEFLRRGGPERDPLNLDPDGDGFACWWDPEPFRAAARAINDG
jgi:hypothetical protein